MDSSTLDSGINVGVRLFIFEKFWMKQKLKNDRNGMIDVKWIKIMMWKFLIGGATFIPGGTSIPESRVGQGWLQFFNLD